MKFFFATYFIVFAALLIKEGFKYFIHVLTLTHNLFQNNCSTFLYRGEEILAVASLNHDPIVAKVAEIMAEGKMLTKTEVV